VTARERIPRGHKMAIVPIAKDEPVRKFAQIIGFCDERHHAGRLAA
jgi:altronate hydrolase